MTVTALGLYPRDAVLVHGIGNRPGGAPPAIARLAGELHARHWSTLAPERGWLLPEFLLKPLAYRLLTPLCLGPVHSLRRIAERFKRHGSAIVAGIGHSFGCNLLAEASRAGAPFDFLVFFNAAAPREFELGLQTRLVLNYYQPEDRILLLTYLPPARWLFGPLGRHEILAPYGHARIRSFNQHQLFGITGHSAAFDSVIAGDIARHMVEQLEIESLLASAGGATASHVPKE